MPDQQCCEAEEPKLLNEDRDLQDQLQADREYCEAIIEALPPLLVLDEQMQVKTANSSFCETFRISARQTLHRRVYDLGNGQWNIPALRVLLEEVLPKKKAFKDFEVTHTFEQIGKRTMMVSGRQVDHLQRILLFIVDITDRQQARAAIEVSEIRYRRLFEAARDGILILSPHTRKITDANPFMSELLGYSRDGLLGKELWEIGLLQDEKANQAAFCELQANHFIRYEDLPLQDKTGNRREVEFVSNLYDEAGQSVIQCNIRDITRRKETEESLVSAKEEISRHAAELERVVAERTSELRKSIGELEEFSYSVSHDMRAPLRAMQSFAQFLADEYSDKLDEKGLDYLHRIMRSAVRLDHLIQDVLSYTRIHHAPLSMGRVDLDRLVRDVIETLPNGYPIKPEIRVTGTLPQVIGNEALLAQCVSNILSNGAKFVAAGTTPELEVHAELVEDKLVRLWFADNGIGIAPQDHKRVFRLFERIGPAARFEGTGIGLSIVRKAAERMGASIGFDSALGAGTRFWLLLQKA
jgi:PAS domain S-box-containing protein